MDIDTTLFIYLLHNQCVVEFNNSDLRKSSCKILEQSAQITEKLTDVKTVAVYVD